MCEADGQSKRLPETSTELCVHRSIDVISRSTMSRSSASRNDALCGGRLSPTQREEATAFALACGDCLRLGRKHGQHVLRVIQILLRRMVQIAAVPSPAVPRDFDDRRPSSDCATSTCFKSEANARRAIAGALLQDIRDYLHVKPDWIPSLRQRMIDAVGACRCLVHSLDGRDRAIQPSSLRDTDVLCSHVDRNRVHEEYVRGLDFLQPYAKGGFGRVMLATSQDALDSRSSDPGSTTAEQAGAGAGPIPPKVDAPYVRVAKAINLQGLH